MKNKKHIKRFIKIMVEAIIIAGEIESIVLISRDSSNSKFGIHVGDNKINLDEKFIIYLKNEYGIEVYTNYEDSTTKVEVHSGHLRSKSNCEKKDNIENLPLD